MGTIKEVFRWGLVDRGRNPGGKNEKKGRDTMDLNDSGERLKGSFLEPGKAIASRPGLIVKKVGEDKEPEAVPEPTTLTSGFSENE